MNPCVCFQCVLTKLTCFFLPGFTVLILRPYDKEILMFALKYRKSKNQDLARGLGVPAGRRRLNTSAQIFAARKVRLA